MNDVYHWWTVFGWRDRRNVGVKFGVVTFNRYYADGQWWWAVLLLGHPLYDGWTRMLRRTAQPR